MRNWWSRACGGREVLAMALPLIVSTASWTIMNFIDRMFLLQYSTAAMAAAMPAGMVHFTVICFPLGLASYVNTFVAQYYGAGQLPQIGRAVWQGVWVGLAATPLFLLTIPLAPHLFLLAGHDPEVAALETTYYQVLAYGAGGEVIAAALACFFSGRGATLVVMAVDFAAAAINCGLDYLWIFGHWGFPEMGITGAALATVVALWFRVVAYGGLMLCHPRRKTYLVGRGCRYDAGLMRRLLRFGSPNGLQMLLEVAAFTVFIMFVGQLGQEAIAATTLAFNVNSLSWVPMLGMGLAVSTLVGHQLGRDQPAMAARATWTAFGMSQAYLSTMALLYVLVPDAFLFAHAAATAPDRFAPLRDTAVVLLRFVALYSLFDSMNLIFVSAIKGAGDTVFILLTSALVSPLPLLAAWAGIHVWGGGLYWCWTVITIWICVLALIYLVRFLQGRWREMRVIEPEYLIGEGLSANPEVSATHHSELY